MAFQFFRKHQKLILFTAGIFALVSFSITGAIMAFFAPGAQAQYQPPRLTLPDGRLVDVTYEDWTVGRSMVAAQNQPAVVLPSIADGDDRESLAERYAAVRRLAIEYGIDAADEEVDRAIDQAVQLYEGRIESPTRLALQMGYSSLAHYRRVVREAMRIGTFLRLQALGVDVLDAALAASVLKDEKVLTYSVAVLDKKARQEALEEVDVSDDDLRAWLEELSETDRVAYADTNHVAMGAVGVLFDEFDAAEWANELAGFAVDQQKIEQEYAQRKERWFRRPEPEQEEGDEEEGDEDGTPEESGQTEGSGGGGNGADGGAGAGRQDPAESEEPAPAVPQSPETQNPETEQSPAATEGQDPEGEVAAEGETQGPPAPPPAPDPYFPLAEVREQLERMLRAEAALDAVRTGVVQDRMAEHMRAVVGTRNNASLGVSKAREALAEAETALADEGESDEREAAVESAKADLEAAEEELEAAVEAMNARRAEFDFVGEMLKVIEDRAGVRTHRVEEPVNQDGLKELGELGTWDNAWVATSMTADGDLSTQVQRTDTACFHFQVPDVVVRPLKPFDEIRDKARSDYFAKKADEQSKADSEKLTELLLELAKAKIGDKIAEIEEEVRGSIDTDFDAWKEELDAGIAKASEMVAGRPPQSAIARKWQAERDRLEAELAKADDKRKELEEAADEAIEEQVAEAAAEVYHEVFEEAAAQVNFELRTIGPLPASLSRQPRFADRFGDDVRYLFGNPDVTSMDPGEVTEVLDDATGRAYYLAHCIAKDPATVKDITRRQLLQAREQFERERYGSVLPQSFTLEALKARWNYDSPTAVEEPSASAAQPAETEGS